MNLSWIEQAAGWFTADQYLYWTRLQGSLWTLADIVIVFYLIRCANILRRVVGKRTHVGSYVFWASTLPLSLFLPVAPSGMFFFRLEVAVTVPHFLLILYLLTSNASLAKRGLFELLQPNIHQEKKTDTQLS